jgi:hypothetical protein
MESLLIRSEVVWRLRRPALELFDNVKVSSNMFDALRYQVNETGNGPHLLWPRLYFEHGARHSLPYTTGSTTVLSHECDRVTSADRVRCISPFVHVEWVLKVVCTPQ